MKKANIYQVYVKDNSVKEGKTKITCVAETLNDIIELVAPFTWNQELNKREAIKYDITDIIEVKLIESNVLVQNYIPDYKEEN